MNRRKFVLGLGALAGGGAAAMGTGAFSNVEAQRDISVTVSDDANAYLGIQPTDGPNGNYVDTTSNDALAIDLTASNNNVGSGIAGGEGLNANAFTEIADVFEIRNQGTQKVEVTATPLSYLEIDSGIVAVLLVPQNAPAEFGFGIFYPVDGITVKELDPGDYIRFGLIGLPLPESAIDSSGISDELEITAEAM